MYSNDRLGGAGAVEEEEKARKDENQRRKERQKIRHEISFYHLFNSTDQLSSPLLPSPSHHSTGVKIKAIQTKLSLMQQQEALEKGKLPSSYSTRDPNLRSKPY